MNWLAPQDNNSATITIYVQPKASRNRIVGLHGDAVKISITAPPVDGKANESVVRFFAKLLKIPKSAITIISGETGRTKRLLLSGISATEVRETIDPLLA